VGRRDANAPLSWIPSCPGESIRYAAFLEGEWVALLGWGSRRLEQRASGPEDRMDCSPAGPASVLFRRLPALPHSSGGPSSPLASKVLALCMCRLFSDWEDRYGPPILFVETFVDPSRFSGTSYKAAGFQDLGGTRGYRKNAGRYNYQGEVKRFFVRFLRKDAFRLLSFPDNLPIFQSMEARVPVKALDNGDSSPSWTVCPGCRIPGSGGGSAIPRSPSFADTGGSRPITGPGTPFSGRTKGPEERGPRPSSWPFSGILRSPSSVCPGGIRSRHPFGTSPGIPPGLFHSSGSET